MPNRTESTAARAQDPRPARTRAAILDAIERLGEANTEISVAAVVAEAQLSRSSFYSQFKDIGDVAVQLMRDIAAEMLRLDLRLRPSEGGRASTIAVTGYMLSEMQRRRGLFAAVLGSAASVESEREICRVIAESMQQSVSTQVDEEMDAETVSLFIVSGMLSVTTAWLIAGCPYSLSELQERIVPALPNWLLE